MKTVYRRAPKVILLSIGRELLCGWTRDSDGPFLAKKLTSLGCKITRLVMLDDEEKAIVEELRDAQRRKPDLIFTTGGLGPTFDDMTLRCVAKALRLRLRLHRGALKQVEEYYAEMKRRRLLASAKLGNARRKMAILPEGAEPLSNPCGAAPGVEIRAGRSTIFCLPGVPPEMKGIFLGSILPRLRAAIRSHPAEIHVPFRTKDESTLVPAVAKVMRRYPSVYIKTRVSGAKERIRIVATLHGPQRDVAKAAALLRRAHRSG